MTMSRITSIVPRTLKWLVGHSEEKLMREPFGTEMRMVTVQVIPKEAKPPLSEGGNSVIVTLSCGHTLEWERPHNAYYSSLEEWAQGLQGRVRHRVHCRQCAELNKKSEKVSKI
jgi:hypothetical protein